MSMTVTTRKEEKRKEPDSWGQVPLQLVSEIRAGDLLDNVGVEEGRYPAYGANGQIGWSRDLNVTRPVVAVGQRGTIGSLHRVEPGSFVNGNSLIITPLSQLNVDFAYYALSVAGIKELSYSTAIPMITAAQLGGVRIPLPPLAEQESIADYLDRETAEIDSMVGDLDSFLVLLADRRRTLITDVVYGKTGPGAGEGFQQIPLHQLVTVNDDSLPETCSPEFSFDYVDISSVSNHEISSCLERYSFSDAPSRARRLARQGDVVLSTVRTYLKAIAPVTHDHEGHVFSTGFAVLRPDQQRCDSNYLRHALFTDDFINEVVGRSNGVSYPAINSSNLLKIRVNVPSVPIQREIAGYLDWETGQIDLLIEDARCTRELLVERREALISDAVTGKLNITSWN